MCTSNALHHNSLVSSAYSQKVTRHTKNTVKHNLFANQAQLVNDIFTCVSETQIFALGWMGWDTETWWAELTNKTTLLDLCGRKWSIKINVSSRFHPFFSVCLWKRQTENSSANTAVIVMVVIAILLTSAVAGVWLVKKYVCGGRWVGLCSSPHTHTHTHTHTHMEKNCQHFSCPSR